MRYAVDPRQMALFDTAETMFSPKTIKFLSSNWPAVFRLQILHLMPAAILGKHFDPAIGSPIKELYGMAGALLLKEFFNLTIPQTVERYLTDAAWQYALNVNPMEASMSHATIERYLKLFLEDDLAADVFHRVTSAMAEALELDVSRQRLDSTHIYSDMATFGRTRLMGVTIKRFLVQLKRHRPDLYETLDAELVARYAVSQANLFGDFTGPRAALRQRAAEDLLLLVSRFAGHADLCARSSYKAMERVLREQCDVVEETVVVKSKTGGDVMQNPSDPDATYDGHKGPGYQVQIAETCSPDNDVQLITGVQTEPAHHSDQEAPGPMLDQLESHGRKPEILYADGQYGSDANVVDAAGRSVDLQSPVSGVPRQNPQDLTIDDFAVAETTQTVECCPNGHAPICSIHDSDKGRTRTVMAASACQACPSRNECPVKKVRNEYVIEHTATEQRLASRRAEQATDAFKEHYAIRAGGESVNAGLKRKTGLGRLRVRGSAKVRVAVMLRCAGWNLFRALAAMKRRRIGVFQAFSAARTALYSRIRRLSAGIDTSCAFCPPPIAFRRRPTRILAA